MADLFHAACDCESGGLTEVAQNKPIKRAGQLALEPVSSSHE